MHYYQHHIGDFIRDTSCLSNSQSAAYLRLLWIYYESEKPLPDDIDVLAMRVGSTPADVSLLLRAFFKKDGETWRHSRCDREIAEYHEIVDRNRHNGKLGGRPKKKPSGFPDGSQSVPSGNPVESQWNPSGNPDETLTSNHEPITNNQLSKDNKRVALSCPGDVGQQVWADWIALRKSKKAPATQTALDGIAKEAINAGITLEQALSMCCERGWTGFKASWLHERKQGNTQVAETAYQRSMRMRMQEAVPQIAAVDPSIPAGDFFRTIEMVEVVR